MKKRWGQHWSELSLAYISKYRSYIMGKDIYLLSISIDRTVLVLYYRQIKLLYSKFRPTFFFKIAILSALNSICTQTLTTVLLYRQHGEGKFTRRNNTKWKLAALYSNFKRLNVLTTLLQKLFMRANWKVRVGGGVLLTLARCDAIVDVIEQLIHPEGWRGVSSNGRDGVGKTCYMLLAMIQFLSRLLRNFDGFGLW